MNNTEPQTYFDTPERSSSDEIISRTAAFYNNSPVVQTLEGIPDPVIVLDKNRQIIAFNQVAKKFFGINSGKEILGKRLGDAIHCKFVSDTENGCGTTKHCAECGAARSIKFTRDTKINGLYECRTTAINNGQEQSFDFKVSTGRLNMEGEEFIIFTIKDILDQKRREILESVFFHDVLNTAGALYNMALMLPELEDLEELHLFYDSLKTASEQLMGEIKSQRDLVYAESGVLAVNPQYVTINELVGKVVNIYKKSAADNSREIVYSTMHPNIIIETDAVYLQRSLSNLIKNALEASAVNDKIFVYMNEVNSDIIFNVRNFGVIPRRHQLNIFQRSFSTKQGKGRGIGTYSVKLFVEQYLHGKVYFKSNAEEGTIFSIRIPLTFPK